KPGENTTSYFTIKIRQTPATKERVTLALAVYANCQSASSLICSETLGRRLRQDKRDGRQEK
ncbi:MAG TPA: hypothetical protein VJ001_05200, partial [Rhodocyclaceae bacterium]|nr:hypothetical protein [Rhodocyclaceae bacterium]